MKIVAFPFIDFVETPIGQLIIKATQHHIHEVYFNDEPITRKSSPLIQQATQQFKEYFAGKRTQFDLPIAYDGTTFQKEVWDKVAEIPFGKTLSYLELAEQVGDENKTRAVGSANGKNKLAILIPCHRVIAVDGKLTGYAWGLKRKNWLLDFEAKQSGNKLSLF
jgi:methylated-DNA-[protein]-cysteine S-methyltransferase